MWQEEYENKRPRFEDLEKSTNIAAPVTVIDTYIPQSKRARDFEKWLNKAAAA